jgi:pimeloyl-ACP methyl ester carboxylesterase
MSDKLSTFVLVHGAWCGGWVWREVADRLRANGHHVYTPTLTGQGERSHLLSPQINLTTHITDVVNLIKWEQLSNIVLVGHSYGGMVVSGVTEKVAGGTIGSIVFLDAAVPSDAQSLYDFLGAPMVPEGIVPPPAINPQGRPHTSLENLDRLRSLLSPQSRACFAEKVRLTGALDRIPIKTCIEALVKAGPGPANSPTAASRPIRPGATRRLIAATTPCLSYPTRPRQPLNAPQWLESYSALTISSVIFLASPNSIIVLSR